MGGSKVFSLGWGQHRADVRPRGAAQVWTQYTLRTFLPPPLSTTVSSHPSMPYQMKAIAKDSFLYANKYILRDTRIEVNHSTTPYYFYGNFAIANRSRISCAHNMRGHL